MVQEISKDTFNSSRMTAMLCHEGYEGSIKHL
jgi:hypothetical protein